jgi:hypothetical protein
VIYPITHVLGYLFFLFFLGSLGSALRRAEGDNGWLSVAAFGGGLISLTIRFSGSQCLCGDRASTLAGTEQYQRFGLSR